MKQTKLYIKTHNVTGLKYFGKTIKSDAESYSGSGTYWKRHLKKHGTDLKTEIVFKSSNINDITKFAINFSEENDIVNSKKWANLIVENGLDGSSVPGVSCFNIDTGESEFVSSEEFSNREELVGKTLGDKKTGEKISKVLTGRYLSETHKKNLSDAQMGNVRCFDIETGENHYITKEEFKKSPNMVSHNFGSKILNVEQMRHFGEDNHQFGKLGEESSCGNTIWVKHKNRKNGKRVSIRFLSLYKIYGWVKGKKQTSPSYTIRKCPYCGTEGKGPNMTRYHFKNCKKDSNV